LLLCFLTPRSLLGVSVVAASARLEVVVAVNVVAQGDSRIAKVCNKQLLRVVDEEEDDDADDADFVIVDGVSDGRMNGIYQKEKMNELVGMYVSKSQVL
jgi:hypothetical protein